MLQEGWKAGLKACTTTGGTAGLKACTTGRTAGLKACTTT